MAERRHLPHLSKGGYAQPHQEVKQQPAQNYYADPSANMPATQNIYGQPPIYSTQAVTNPNPNPNPYVQPHQGFVNETQPNPGTTQTTTPNMQSNYGVTNTTDINNNMGNRKKSSKIDPDQIPRPTLTTDDSMNLKRYTTSQRPGIPFQSQIPYITVDDGNAGPRLMRASVYNLPNEPANLNQTHIPFGVLVQPLADTTVDEEVLPVVEYPQGPFRCGRCKAYVNPYFEFIEQGRSAVCNLCKMNNPVANEYFCNLNEFGKRRDRQSRSELHKGAYEFIAPKDYYNKPIQKNYLMICLEMTVPSISNGIFNQALSSIQSILDYIPAVERTEICFMTFDNQMTFYKIPQDLSAELQTIIVGDLDDPCIPLPKETLFINAKDGRHKIDYLLEKLLKIAEQISKINAGKAQFHSTPIGSVINNAANYFAPEVGRILLFSTQMPTIGYGKIKRRDDYKLINTDKEKNLFIPQADSFDKLGKLCLENRVGVDLFIFGSEYYDLTTVSPICSITGGSLYYYPQYNYLEDGEKLHYDLARNFTRVYAYDAIMTIRTSQGIVLQEYHTGYGKVAVRDLEYSVMDADKALAIFLKQEEKITEQEAYVQYAILYTNAYGQRVIRVLNMNFSINNAIPNIYRAADIDCTLNLILRKYSTLITQQPIKSIREQITQLIVNILYSYRVNCASSSTPGQLILPEGLKLLPLYIQSAFKHDLFNFGSGPDARSWAMYNIGTESSYAATTTLYPKLYQLHNIFDFANEQSPGFYFEDRVIMPASLALTKEKLVPNGLYIIDNNETLYIYVMKGVNIDILQQLFRVENFYEIIDTGRVPNFADVEYGAKVNAIIDQLRKYKNSAYQNVKIITEKDPLLDQFFLNLLIEDDVKSNEAYADFLCTIHKMIQQKYT